MVNEARIKQIFDTELKTDKLGENFEEINENVIKLFQKLFVENLNFDLVRGQFGEIGEQISTEDWNKIAEAEKAFIIAEKEEFRIIHIIIKKLTRFRERSAISSLKREKWARKGEYICIFYAQNSKIWHMVCPYFTEGRPILRRFVLGEGENHRTVSQNLAKMDASLIEPLYERVQEAFKVKAVTKDFYEDYKKIFQETKNTILLQGVKVSGAKKFTHLLLNRLMFIYFIQKKGWINNDKNFMKSFLKQYKSSGEEELFYEKWLYTLFFKAMSKPRSDKSINLFNNEINNILNNIPFLNGGLFEEYDVDNLNLKLPDDFLFKIIDNFLEEYNFTITEESPFDLDIAIDPAMLGKIYESLIAEEERGKSGIFYTPRLEVDLMCRLGIYEYFLQDRNHILPKEEYIEKKLLKFIFEPLEDWNPEDNKKYEFLRKALNQIKIIDPACGSGAFLVGMLNVLLELFMKLGLILDYNIKENIIYNSLFGVDIKDWAIRMAEFRLWLSVIESEENPPNKSPILPNFSFKLQCGDSLIQKIEKTDFNLRDYRTDLYKIIHEDIEKTSYLKKQFFEGNKNLFNEIKEKQIKMVLNALQKEVTNFKLLITQKSQRDLTGNLTEKSKEEIEPLELKLKNLNILIKNIKENINKEFFIWELNFPEVMFHGGFDIVIANPPYVRQEKIINQGIDPEELLKISTNQLKKLKSEYKDELIRFVKENFKLKLGKKCDLYVYFFFKAMDLINIDGVIIFISSLSWLDVDYGKYLQKGILKSVNLKCIIDNQVIRSFEEANVNTIITILLNKRDKGFLYGSTNFITLYKPFEEINNPGIISEIIIEEERKKLIEISYLEEKFDIFKDNNYRKISIEEKSLWRLGLEESKTIQTTLKQIKNLESIEAIGNYEGGQWGKYLRAPMIYFTILDRNNEILVPLKKLANVRRGFTTGANEFFYVPKPGKKNKFFKSQLSEDNNYLYLFPKNRKTLKKFQDQGYNIEENKYIFCIETEFLKDIIFTLKEIDKYYINSNNLKFYFISTKSDQIERKKIKEYIEWGVNQGYNVRPTCNSRRDWIDLVLEKSPAPLIFPSKVGERMPITLNPDNIFEDKKQYGIIPYSKENLELLFLILNSSFFRLFIEIESRQLTGAQAIVDIDVIVVENIKIPNITKINEKIKKELKEIVNDLRNLDANSIRDDLGALNSEDFDIVKMNNIRKKLDDIVLGKILGLNINEQIEVYKTIIDIIKNRLEKADSV